MYAGLLQIFLPLFLTVELMLDLGQGVAVVHRLLRCLSYYMLIYFLATNLQYSLLEIFRSTRNSIGLLSDVFQIIQSLKIIAAFAS